MNGGRRPRAGRKKGSRNAAQLKIIDIAGQVLQEIDAKEKWKALLNCDDRLDERSLLFRYVH
jgi:hypothetical protein